MAFAQRATHLAVAVSFLLLSSCRSLQVMEDGLHNILLAAHHKSGTELLSQASRCFDSSFDYTVDRHWEGDRLDPHEKALHLIRDPISLLLSAYMYHRATGEEWTRQPGGAWTRLKNDPFFHNMVLHDESYTAFLLRVDEVVGIRAEIHQLTNEFIQIESAEKYCGVSSRCLQMCLEDFTVSSSSYDASWRKIFNFMGKQQTPEIYKCLSRSDLNRNLGPGGEHSSHITTNSISESKYNYLRNVAAELDAKVYNGRLKTLAKVPLHCGASALVTGSDVGREYTGWLIDNEYA